MFPKVGRKKGWLLLEEMRSLKCRREEKESRRFGIGDAGDWEDGELMRFWEDKR